MPRPIQRMRVDRYSPTRLEFKRSFHRHLRRTRLIGAASRESGLNVPHFSTKQRILDSAESLFARHGFAGASLRQVTASANVTELDPEIRPEEIATTYRPDVELDSVLSNSFGFGGTNATLAFTKLAA